MNTLSRILAGALLIGLTGILGAGGCEARSTCADVCSCRGGCSGEEYDQCLSKALELKDLASDERDLPCTGIGTALGCSSGDDCSSGALDYDCSSTICFEDPTECECYLPDCDALFSILAEGSDKGPLDCANLSHGTCVYNCSLDLTSLLDPDGYRSCIEQCTGLELPDGGGGAGGGGGSGAGTPTTTGTGGSGAAAACEIEMPQYVRGQLDPTWADCMMANCCPALRHCLVNPDGDCWECALGHESTASCQYSGLFQCAFECLTPAAPLDAYYVSPALGMTLTGIHLGPNDTIELHPQPGQWCWGQCCDAAGTPGTPTDDQLPVVLPGGSLGMLVGFIGNHAFEIGGSPLTIKTGSPGNLAFAMNEQVGWQYLSDNTGEMLVQVIVYPGSP